MPSAFQRKARTLPSTAGSSSAGPSASSSSSTAQQAPQDAPRSSPSTSSLRPSPHPTLRPSPFPTQQPLPLFSLGLSAINDILTGLGLPSGSLALFCPQESEPRLDLIVQQEQEDEARRLQAGGAYADLVLRYGAVQGIAAGQRVIVVGEGAQAWTNGLMGWKGQEAEQGVASTASSSTAIANKDMVVPEVKEKQEDLGSAFRYARLKKLDSQESGQGRSSSDDTNPTPYLHPFDLSTKIAPAMLREAGEQDLLFVHDLSPDWSEDSGNTYEEAWKVIQERVHGWKAQEEQHRQAFSTSEQTSPPPPIPIRVILPCFGSPAWSLPPNRSHATESYRFLLRLKSLVRSSSWVGSSSDIEIPMIALVSPDPSLLLATRLQGISLLSRFNSLADASLAFSSFASDPRLRLLFGLPMDSVTTSSSGPSSSSSSSSSASTPAPFTGSLSILKTPHIGSLNSPSIRASTLRGFSSLSADAGGSGGGSSENSLGFKVRRKGIKVEIMGRDLVAGGEKPSSDSGSKKEASSSASSSSRAPPRRQEAASAAQQVILEPSKEIDIIADQSTQQQQAQSSGPMSSSEVDATSSTAATPSPKPLKGIAALRARGLQAKSSAAVKQEAEIEERFRKEDMLRRAAGEEW